MATGAGIEGVGGPIRRLFGDGVGLGDGRRGLAPAVRRGSRPRWALEVLVARHGPDGPGRLPPGSSATATPRKTPSRPPSCSWPKRPARSATPDRLGPWLHGVAHRVAVRARADLARRKDRERPRRGGTWRWRPPADEAGFDRLELRAAPRRGSPPAPREVPRPDRPLLPRRPDPRRGRDPAPLPGRHGPEPALDRPGQAPRPAGSPRRRGSLECPRGGDLGRGRAGDRPRLFCSPRRSKPRPRSRPV